MSFGLYSDAGFPRQSDPRLYEKNLAFLAAVGVLDAAERLLDRAQDPKSAKGRGPFG